MPEPTDLQPPPHTQTEPTAAAPAGGEDTTAPLAPEDFYYEGPFLVFTAAYHLKRGFCCNSGCRHCPYR
jgi:hypothetical protein